MKALIIGVLFVSTVAGAQNFGPFADDSSVHNATEVAEFDRLIEMSINLLTPREISRAIQEGLIGAEIPTGASEVATNSVVNNRAFNPQADSIVRKLTFAVALRAVQPPARIPSDAKGYDRNVAIGAATDEIQNTTHRARFVRLLTDLSAGPVER